MTVHHALSSYEVRKNELVNTEISKLREMTQVLNSVLASLNLPAAIEDTSGTEVPQSLIEKAASVRIAGGIKALETAMNDLPDLLQRNKDILDEVSPKLNHKIESRKKKQNNSHDFFLLISYSPRDFLKKRAIPTINCVNNSKIAGPVPPVPD